MIKRKFTSIVDDIEYSRQVDYIGQDILLAEARVPLLTKSIILTLLLGFSGLILWASTTTVKEIVKSEGEIRPSTKVHSIKHMHGGTIVNIYVNEGQIVAEGDILFTLEDKGLRSRENSIRNEIESLKIQFKNLQLGNSSTKTSKVSLINKKLISLKDELSKITNKIETLNIRSESAGIARAIKAQNIGDTIVANEKIMEIVPIESTTNAIIRISPNDIGFVQVNMPVDIKVNSYNYRIYGSVEGIITSISPYTYYSDENESYYRGVVRLSKNYMGNDDIQNLILPGMKIHADILTARKSILKYLIGPLEEVTRKPFFSTH
ncbi:HlyD family efflux transporter periplasmic adaptor subunit [Halobacteriovorax sp.]|uniref:HlyD family efflux transporter periplasmic adaptor subunit n=1 Tax=Halobacteriovorax sp. TaxID=2020862 RepID=UPI003AF2273B